MERHAVLDGVPVAAGLLEDVVVGHGESDGALALDKVERQALRRVPGDVAVDDPGARVVELKGDGEVAAGGEVGGVAADGVDGVEGRLVGEGGGVLREDPEVVAVEVDGVVDADAQRAAVDDEAEPLGGVCEGGGLLYRGGVGFVSHFLLLQGGVELAGKAEMD